jgi:uncharacterized Zn finger protein
VKIDFLVQGSDVEPYRLTFTKTGTNLSAQCTCLGAGRDFQCKHRIRILKGCADNVVSGNLSDVAIVASWLEGSDVELALQNLERLEKQAEELKALISVAKRALGEKLSD